MNLYDFKTLSPYEFEVLTQDLLQKELNLTLESFKPGQDQGIDLRYSRNNLNQLIIQCKHFAGSSFSDLKKELKKDAIKIEKLKPKNYKIVTSFKLTPLQKTKIRALFPPDIMNINDVYGCEDLNNLLRKFPEVEKTHFKLWLSSINILECLLHSDVYNKSAYTIEKIKQKIKLFVPNDSLFESFKILKEHNYVVISGAPGVGKTTLAEMLILPYIEQDYELIEVSEDIKSAWTCYQEDKKQIFYFDDFLGQTILQKSLGKNEDGRLVDFIEKIFHSKNKKFILTTREYILNEAKLNYEKLANYEFEQCVIDLKKYTDKIKAHILYNHLFFSGLNIKYFENLLEDNRYFNIIRHKNYNPRIIEYMTKSSKIPPEDYYCIFMDNLNNPFKIWEIAFNKHLDNISRSILLSTVTYSWNSHYNDVEKTALMVYSQIFNGNSFNKIQYKEGLKILNGDLIVLNRFTIDFANPSIKDFLENYILSNNLADDVLSIIQEPAQLKWFYNRYIPAYKDGFIRIKKHFLQKVLNPDFYRTLSISALIDFLCIVLDLIYFSKDKTHIDLPNDYLQHIVKQAQIEDFDLNSFEDLIDKCSYGFFQDSEIIISFLESMKAIFVKNADQIESYEDYVVLNSFIENFNDLFSENEITELKQDFEYKSDDIIETLMEDCKTSDNIEELIEKLENIEGIFEYENLDKVYEKLEYLREQEDFAADNYDPNDWEEYSANRQVEKNPDEEIKEMFHSLYKA